jgi:hypothetical protein
MAEGEGFEPPLPLRVKRFSRPPVSTTHTSLRRADTVASLSLRRVDSDCEWQWHRHHLQYRRRHTCQVNYFPLAWNTTQILNLSISGDHLIFRGMLQCLTRLTLGMKYPQHSNTTVSSPSLNGRSCALRKAGGFRISPMVSATICTVLFECADQPPAALRTQRKRYAGRWA